MNAFDDVRLKVLAALFVDYHRPDSRLMEVADFSSDYHLHVSRELFAAVLAGSKSALLLAESKDGPAARLTPEGYGDVLKEILERSDATMIEIDWRKEEILTDARNDAWIPSPNGWKYFTFERAPSAPALPSAPLGAGKPLSLESAIDWTKWGTLLAGAGIAVSILLWYAS